MLQTAMDDAAAAADRLDLAYEPLTWVRAELVRGQALALLGELRGDVEAIATGAATLAGALDHLVRDHSPLDWARAQVSLARVLTALGEAAADERAFEKAVTCYDRAQLVLREAPASPLRGLAAGERAVCLARSAELTGDLSVLQAAETALKIELAGGHAWIRWPGPWRSCIWPASMRRGSISRARTAAKGPAPLWPWKLRSMSSPTRACGR